MDINTKHTPACGHVERRLACTTKAKAKGSRNTETWRYKPACMTMATNTTSLYKHPAASDNDGEWLVGDCGGVSTSEIHGAVADCLGTTRCSRMGDVEQRILSRIDGFNRLSEISAMTKKWWMWIIGEVGRLYSRVLRASRNISHHICAKTGS
jgi:hypothetical protein